MQHINKYFILSMHLYQFVNDFFQNITLIMFLKYKVNRLHILFYSIFYIIKHTFILS